MKRLSLTPLLVLSSAMLAHADPLDDYIRAQMSKYGVPGLSLAIVEGGKIAETRVYGVLEVGTHHAVTPTTLFQAGSISKSVAAVGTLRLVDKGLLNLDEDVNVKLKSWKVPENEFTKHEKVTLRRILSHTAGLTVHGFPGYDIEAPLANLIQVLNGEKPANTPPIVVDVTPGSIWRYSGGGYTVMQQLMLDIQNSPYDEFMQKTVLDPLDMTDSSYRQPQTLERAARTAAGTTPDGKVHGRWHLYPEMAAAGLWTTPTDLCKFILAIQKAYAGGDGAILSEPLAQQALTVQRDGDGLGMFLAGSGASLQFSHNGRDEGFDALYVGYATTGQGVAIMINDNENSGMVYRISQLIGGERNWPGYPRLGDAYKLLPVKVSTESLNSCAGYYQIDQQIVSVVEDGDHLRLLNGNGLVDELIPQGGNAFVMPDQDRRATFETDTSGSIVSFTNYTMKNEKLGTLPRICGPLSQIRPVKDPNPDRTKVVRSFFLHVTDGGAPIADDPHLTPGVKRDFRAGIPDLKGFEGLSYLGEADFAPNHATRHGGLLAHIVQYRIRQNGKTRYVIVYFTKDGLITDFDVVNN